MQDDLKVQPFANVITKAALSTQLTPREPRWSITSWVRLWPDWPDRSPARVELTTSCVATQCSTNWATGTRFFMHHWNAVFMNVRTHANVFFNIWIQISYRRPNITKKNCCPESRRVVHRMCHRMFELKFLRVQSKSLRIESWLNLSSNNDPN